MPIKRHQVKSKLTVGYVLQSHPETMKYFPATELLTKKNFTDMIRKYKKVYLKPDRGRKSRGIIRVEQEGPSAYLLRSIIKGKQHKFDHFNKLWSEVKELTAGRRYVVQQEIKSVTNDGRNFDLRCHALRINGEWVIGGICARVGELGNFVTTSHIGGTPTPLETLFTDLLGYDNEEQSEVLERLNDCILQAVKVVSPIYPKNLEFAVDIGLDKEKQVWIYEVNNQPLIRGNFKLLPDKTLYHRIRSLRDEARKSNESNLSNNTD
ncbi:YheC/YheD family protein [Mesobacillus maritimus]|uniref:YheC/YheD family protein n=1 Tax=Mesobacillus maritimus TaxID=1643336 RepID=UPI00203FE8EB|nr:YheC/YheD family protein [Mesobacillus maritimus]MCM3584654.1 YheC/YheD family protein [Mesobacillus maritimus]MCM3671369.1 YheC/YheD family protein [Mesobacillus maritimus]